MYTFTAGFGDVVRAQVSHVAKFQSCSVFDVQCPMTDVRCACRFRVSECYGQYNLVSHLVFAGGGGRGGREVSVFISLLGKRRKYSIPILGLSFQRGGEGGRE